MVGLPFPVTIFKNYPFSFRPLALDKVYALMPDCASHLSRYFSLGCLFSFFMPNSSVDPIALVRDVAGGPVDEPYSSFFSGDRQG